MPIYPALSPKTRGNTDRESPAPERSDSLLRDLQQSVEQTKKGVPLNKVRRDESIEPGRLRRAVALLPFVQQIGPKDFRVKGNDEPQYHVALETNPPCYCRDAEMRGVQCKHELCCRLWLREPQVVQALGDMLLQQEKNLKEALRRTRRRKIAK
jgi:hypothetical protein